jgi:hypothetical protein
MTNDRSSLQFAWHQIHIKPKYLLEDWQNIKEIQLIAKNNCITMEVNAENIRTARNNYDPFIPGKHKVCPYERTKTSIGRRGEPGEVVSSCIRPHPAFNPFYEGKILTVPFSFSSLIGLLPGPSTMVNHRNAQADRATPYLQIIMRYAILTPVTDYGYEKTPGR